MQPSSFLEELVKRDIKISGSISGTANLCVPRAVFPVGREPAAYFAS
ncbi:MAG: hypothetical protein SCJ94_09375 [Bacillota bacterium]|nr:hypothetical protein [Bacillota bacterium]